MAKPTRPLPQRQQKVLQYLIEYQTKHGRSPTVREIAEGIGVSSPATILDHLTNLEERGLVSRLPRRHRSLSVVQPVGEGGHVPPKPEVRTVPLLGRVAAGEPLATEAEAGEHVAIPAELCRVNGTHFVAEVCGASMTEAGIHDGDWVIVRRQETAQNGEVVLVCIEGPAGPEYTVKTYFREERLIRLQAENPAHADLLVTECTILGVVTGLLRTYIPRQPRRVSPPGFH